MGLCASLMGGLVGGVIGLSCVGLPVLPPLSSVMPAPLAAPDPERVASEPDSVMAELDMLVLVEGCDVVGISFIEKRDLCGEVNGSGADCR